MKRIIFISVLAFAAFCTAKAQDDVYYIPSKEVRVVKSDDGTIVSSDRIYSDKALNYQETRNVDEYNRHGSVADSLERTYVKEVESTFDDYNDEVAYPYTKIVMRFHSPHPGVVVSSPYYWDICYGDVWDVYYDSWAWSSPSYSWWSYAYDPWYYNRWHYRTCWDFTWGWYDPWWSHSYWGWGRPIYWGWSRPAFNPHHMGRPMWAHRDYRFGGRDFAYGYGGGRRGFVPRDFGRRDVGYRGGFTGPRRDNGVSAGRRDYDRPRIVRAPGRGNEGRTDYSRPNRADNNRAYGRGESTTRRESFPSQRTESSNRGSSPSFGAGSRPSGGGGVMRGGGGVSRGGGGVMRGGGGGRR